jgi:hypothetical protein
MKQTLLALSALFIISCDNGSKPVSVKSDSTWTSVLYAMDWNRNDYRASTAIRIMKDTLKVDTTNPTKNIVVTDTIYIVPIFIDSMVNGQPVYDSLKRKVQNLQWVVLPKNLLLQDYNKNWKDVQK